MNSAVLISELINLTQTHLQKATSLLHEDLSTLNLKKTETAWSVLECLEHLNLYGDFYLPEIEEQMKRKSTLAVENFKPGWLGNYFAESMKPSPNMKKMKTFKDKNPNKSQLDFSTVERFIKQQKELLHSLEQAKSVNLNTVKTKITLSPWIKLKLGDTLRFVIFHNERHLVQANNALEFFKALA